MRHLFLGLLFALFATSTLAQGSLPATYVTATDVERFYQGLPKNERNDLPIRVVDCGGSRLGVYGVFRPVTDAGDAIAHETNTSELYYILEGAGTLVTGGTIADPKVSDRFGAGPRGGRIDGGVSRRVTKGDMIVIPGRTPHWWSSLEGDIRYLIIRSDPAGRLTLK